MKKLLAMASIIAILIPFGCSKKEAEEYAMITFMIGDVTLNNAAVSIGDLIKENDIILTGKSAFCDVKIGGSIIRIKEKSEVTISSLFRKGGIEKTDLGLGVGKMLCKPKKLLKSESFLVKTPTAVAGVRGTRFVVEADKVKTTRIKVYDGKVKIVRRVKHLEDSIEKVLEVAPTVNQEEKVIVTQKEVEKAEKAVEKALKKQAGKVDERVIEAVIKETKNEVVINTKDIEKFAVEDFAKEKAEIIEVKEKSPEVIDKIAKAVKKEKEKPKPDGRLLITRYEIYYIKEGKVVWEGKVVSEPVKEGNKIYIASGKYIFCADIEGPVLWKQEIENDGAFSIKDAKLQVSAKGKKIYFDLENGKRL